MPLLYDDLDLTFERDGERYVVRLRSPAGEAQGTFILPFDQGQIHTFYRTVGHLNRAMRGTESPEESAARRFGSDLFKATFTGELLSRLHLSLNRSKHSDRGLRLRLRFKETPELAELPWEFLYNSDEDHFVATSRWTPLVRYLELAQEAPPLRVQLPLRILVIVARTGGSSAPDSSGEWRQLKSSLGRLVRMGDVVLEKLTRGTLGALQERARGTPFHIVHFIGHGSFDESTKDGLLHFRSPDGGVDRVSGSLFGSILRNHSSLRLAVLNACDGARQSLDDPFSGVAQSLCRQGLPASVAMQFQITDEAAKNFAREFYKAIAEGYPVDAAVSESRLALYTRRLGQEWATPVLYMRSSDGLLFEIEKTARDNVPQSPAYPPPQLATESVLSRQNSGVQEPDEANRSSIEHAAPEATRSTERLAEPVEQLSVQDSGPGLHDENLESSDRGRELEPVPLEARRDSSELGAESAVQPIHISRQQAGTQTGDDPVEVSETELNGSKKLSGDQGTKARHRKAAIIAAASIGVAVSLAIAVIYRARRLVPLPPPTPPVIHTMPAPSSNNSAVNRGVAPSAALAGTLAAPPSPSTGQPKSPASESSSPAPQSKTPISSGSGPGAQPGRSAGKLGTSTGSASTPQAAVPAAESPSSVNSLRPAAPPQNVVTAPPVTPASSSSAQGTQSSASAALANGSTSGTRSSPAVLGNLAIYKPTAENGIVDFNPTVQRMTSGTMVEFRVAFIAPKNANGSNTPYTYLCLYGLQGNSQTAAAIPGHEFIIHSLSQWEWRVRDDIVERTGVWIPGSAIVIDFSIPSSFADASQGWSVRFGLGYNGTFWPSQNLLQGAAPTSAEIAAIQRSQVVRYLPPPKGNDCHFDPSVLLTSFGGISTFHITFTAPKHGFSRKPYTWVNLTDVGRWTQAGTVFPDGRVSHGEFDKVAPNSVFILGPEWKSDVLGNELYGTFAPGKRVQLDFSLPSEYADPSSDWHLSFILRDNDKYVCSSQDLLRRN